MKIRNRAAIAAIAFFLSFICSAGRVSADEAYTYTVTFYAGNQGTFTGTSGVSVRYQKGTVSVQPDKITVSGLQIGDIVSFDAQAGALQMGDNGKYYIKGIRESGRDNNTVTASAFKVDGDADYVVAYGVKGDTVAYKVNYQDEAGNALAESRTYYGNVGDKAVAAYLYIEGYKPSALAMAKTLSANEADNVITFLYVKDETAAGTAGIHTGTQTETAGGITDAQTGTAVGTGTQTQTSDAGQAADAQEDAETADTDREAGEGEDLEEGADMEEGVNLPDDEVPLDQELLDLDDEEVPQGNIKLDNKKIQKGLPLALRIGIGAAAAAALVVLAVLLIRRKKSAGRALLISKNEKESES